MRGGRAQETDKRREGEFFFSEKVGGIYCVFEELGMVLFAENDN
jgi:hypothetical protein